MAGKRNGLGKGLDSLIPNKTVKEESASQQKVSKEKQEKNVGSGEILVKINEVEPNREQQEKNLMKIRLWNWQILSGNLEYYSRFLFKKRKIIMKS